MYWSCGTHRLSLDEPLIMGIVNVTPDSFSDGGNFFSVEQAFEQAMRLTEDGAHIIDVGGESTRPGSDEVSVEEELRRTRELVRRLVVAGLVVSIDTRHVEVARAAVEAGAHIINDISGFSDPAMRALASECDAGLCLMHMKGEPKSMQDNPQYEDVAAEVYAYLYEGARMLIEMGIDHERVCLDPGFGFGKSFAHNQLLYKATLDTYADYPLLIGISRKRYLRELSGFSDNPSLDELTAEINASLVDRDEHARHLGLIFRVHNVEATVRALKSLEQAPGTAYVALGSNQGDRKAQILQAIAKIEALPNTKVAARSVLVSSEAAYLEEQNAFFNAVITLETKLGPWALLNYLQAIEQEMGRVRSIENGPRVIDLDLLSYFEHDRRLHLDNPKLTLPHPGIAERDFVLQPLASLGVDIKDWGLEPADTQYGKVINHLGEL